MKEYTVTEADSDIRLDRWFKRHLPEAAHGWIEKSLRKGLIRLDGAKAKASDRIQAGQVIRLAEAPVASSAPAKKAPQRLSPEKSRKIRDWVIYQDANAIVINKPAGLAVQGGSGQKESVDAMLDALAEQGGERPKLVHRLDKDTSGVLLLARSAKAAAAMAAAFARKDAEKIYWALVIGAPVQGAGVIDLPLAKLAKGSVSRTEVYERMEVEEEEGKHAVTEWRVVERLGRRLAWMELRPITGRTHQLRVHLAAIGHPIVGDGKYGGSEAFVQGMEIPKQLHLHARELLIPALFGKKLKAVAELSGHMKKSWEMLGLSGG